LHDSYELYGGKRSKGKVVRNERNIFPSLFYPEKRLACN